MKTIKPEDLHEKQVEGDPVMIIDVRTPEEYQEVHIKGAHLFPLNDLSVDTLKPALEELGQGDAPVYVTCASGRRAAIACQKLMEDDMSNLVVVDGGTVAWEIAGLPVGHGETP